MDLALTESDTITLLGSPTSVPPDTSAQRLWEAALGRLQLDTPRPTFDTWLANTTGQKFEEGVLVVSVPTAFAAEWIERRMHTLVEAAVSAIGGRQLHVSYTVGSSAGDPSPHSETPARYPHTIAGVPGGPLNPNFNFDSFVIGASNQLAHAAALAVASSPGAVYNPLFLYGDVGLGKTHLLHAIGNHAQNTGRSVLYVTSEEFTNDYVSAIRDRRADAFRQRYRAVDLLLVDDVQLLAGKHGTQEGFFHTFNSLQSRGGQLVMTSDRPAGALTLLEARLRSRFEAGLQADISRPDYETRLSMLRLFTSRAGSTIPDPVLEFLAKYLDQSVRTLHGCLTRLIALADFTSRPFSVELARSALGPHMPDDDTAVSPHTILSKTASYFSLPPGAIAGPRRDREASTARQIAIYLLNRELGLGPEEIGALVGHRERTTIIYSLNRVRVRIQQDSKVRSIAEYLGKTLTRDPALNTQPFSA